MRCGKKDHLAQDCPTKKRRPGTSSTGMGMGVRGLVASPADAGDLGVAVGEEKGAAKRQKTARVVKF